jgi:hypothetical protein
MSNAGRTNWLVAIGGIVAVLGIILYGELGQIGDAVPSLSLLNAAAIMSIIMTVIGLLTALRRHVGVPCAAWSRSFFWGRDRVFGSLAR